MDSTRSSMVKNVFLGLGLGGLIFASPGPTLAVPAVALGPGNVGINGINVSVVGTTISVEEFWTSASPGILQFSGLDEEVDYTLEKRIHNNSGIAWTRFANELLDPAGNTEDSSDPVPQPAFVPAGFSTSNQDDGLSFAGGSGLPRTSTRFASVFEDEFSDARDFLDFFNGTLANGAEDNFMTFGLRDNMPEDNQPFLLSQRPNVFSRTPVVPEPASLLLVGSGLAGLAVWRVKRKQTSPF